MESTVVSISLKHFNQLTLKKTIDGRFPATVGTGGTVGRLYKLPYQYTLTIPTTGLITCDGDRKKCSSFSDVLTTMTAPFSKYVPTAKTF